MLVYKMQQKYALKIVIKYLYLSFKKEYYFQTPVKQI